MIEAKIGKEVDCTVQVSGTALDIAEDVLNLISALYQDIRSQNPADSRMFQAMLMLCVAVPRSPVWNGTVAAAEPQNGGAEE